MSVELYYVPPKDTIFHEVKLRAIELWGTYDNTYGYSSEKINRIRNLENVGDNFMYIFAMFDVHNQSKIMRLLSEDARLAINQRLEL
jgi:hypothetical protein